ncbi:zinc finger MYM-type protein 1-like [Belonocnema kinseyi]|uniref:zinc finger MYM-type protein 1-like n=1 Tax=Belonocnema kinseyi TaxID=2817044 RepID=UPI00143D8BAC|nr:zinc finger MYM-type protein 1-like [Belonocnema kinseyi]
MEVVLLGDNAPVQIQEQEIIESDAAGVHVEEINDEKFKDKTRETLNLYDCGTWPVLRNSSTVDHLIKIGPIQIKNENYPEDEKRRHFSNSYYNRKLSNGEIFCRRWLAYSVSKDSIFCFCCRLFNNKSNSKLVGDGFNNWKYLSETLGIHENSTSHMKCYQQWVQTEIKLKTGATIDKQEQKIIEKESLHWQNVLHLLLNITLYLSANNMAFRGTSDTLYTSNNGKFLGLVQFLAKYDLVMQNQVTRAMNGDISDHYCGKTIQNELIDLMAEKVNAEIISRAKVAIYYAIVADCTPNISRKEQLSFTIRFVDLTDDTVQIKEHFLGFFTVDDTTGLGLTEVLINIMTKYRLELSNCRGQGYDNGSNMKGKNTGVQKRILHMNPLASYVPCGSHNLNLVLCNSAQSSVKSVTLFGILQRLFTLFSASVNRWKILTDHVEIFTLKKLSDTRWEAKISSVKPVRYQISGVHDALITLSETEGCDPDIVHEAITLAEQLRDFSFLISLVVCLFTVVNVIESSVTTGRVQKS